VSGKDFIWLLNKAAKDLAKVPKYLRRGGGDGK